MGQQILQENVRSDDQPAKKPAAKSKPLLKSPAAKSVLGGALDWVHAALDRMNREVEENHFLSGNYAPVEEGPSVAKGPSVTGTLPACLDGEYVRTGPNPKYRPRAGYHWFDGDGMLHGVRIKGGEASYVNRYVRTARLAQEDAAGRAIFTKIGEMKGFSGLLYLLLTNAREYLGLVDGASGWGTANTALVYHNKALLALNEGDAPYVIRVLEDGELETAGRHTYGGMLDHNFTAHPKVDPVSGELFAFGYALSKAPYLTYRVISASGEMGPRVPINLPDPVMMHDFAVTEKYAVFMDLPLVFDPKAMIKNGTLPFVWKGERGSRFGLLPRGDTSEANMRWFKRPSCYIFHNANAWDDGDEVVLLGCRMDMIQLDLKGSITPSYLTEFRFNTKTGESSERQLNDFRCDFPRINDAFMCRKQRFVYAAVLSEMTNIPCIAKFDVTKAPVLNGPKDPSKFSVPELGGCLVGCFYHGPGRFGSEPVFVARNKGSLSPLIEDDGFVLNLVYDSNKGVSDVVVIDAKTFSPNPVAVIHIGRRVPYGFHGIFVSEEEMKAQEKAALVAA